MSFQVTTVTKECMGFGEAPIWDNRRKKLVFVDCFHKSIGILDPKTQVLVQKQIPKTDDLPFIIVGMPCANSTGDDATENPNFLVGTSGQLMKYNWESEKADIVFEFECKETKRKNVNFSDGKCDAKGRFWIGSYDLSGDIGSLGVAPNAGSVHRFENIDRKLTETTHACEYDAPNGLAWNKENTKLFYADLLQRVVNVYDFNVEEGTLGNPRVLFDFSKSGIKGMPDGMVTDQSGNVWVACWKGGSIIKIDGNTGQLLEAVILPVENTTSLCFGGDNYDSLFVTTTSKELDNSPVVGEPDAGKIFRVTAPNDNSFKGLQHYFANI